MILLPDLTGSNILFTPMANKILIYQEDLNLSSSKFTKSPDDRKVKKINVFVLLTQVLCMKLAVSCVALRCVHDEVPQKGKKRKNQTERHKFVFTST